MDSSSVQEALETILWVLKPVSGVFYYVGIVLLGIFRILSGPILTALQPFGYLLYALYWVLSLPIRLIAKLEPVYDYIGAAVILGGTIGLALNYSFHHFDEYLNMDSFIAMLPGQGQTAKQYRETKVKEKQAELTSSPFDYASMSDSMSATTPKSRSKNLLDQTIHEEDDSDF